MASSHTATPAMPSPPWRMDTPCAGRTSLGSNCALVGKSSSANHITQTWVRASSSLKSPSRPAFLACSTCEACLCTLAECQRYGKKGREIIRHKRTKGNILSDASFQETLVTAPCHVECVHQALAMMRAARVQGSASGHARNRAPFSSHRQTLRGQICQGWLGITCVCFIGVICCSLGQI